MKRLSGLLLGLLLPIGFVASAGAAINLEVAEVQNGFAFISGKHNQARVETLVSQPQKVVEYNVHVGERSLSLNPSRASSRSNEAFSANSRFG